MADDDLDAMPPFRLEPTPTRLRQPVVLWVVSVGAAALAARIIRRGVHRVFVGSSSLNCAPSDATCDLAFALAGTYVGAALGVTAYLCVGTAVIASCRSRGRRPGPVAALVTTPLAMAVIGAAASGAF